jgi:tRNA threonylcarbamoyladenosine biosynthesis protein TsaE
MPERSELSLEAFGPAAMREVGRVLAEALPGAESPPVLIELEGDLGTGKTTLTSGFLAALGVPGPHRSPTYTLVEPYEVAGRHVAHLDLYRLSGRDELESIGIRDLIEPGAVLLVEWAGRAAGRLGPADVSLQLGYRRLGESRLVTARAGTVAGERLVAALRSSESAELVVLS